MKDFTFYLAFDDGRKLTVTLQAYSLLSAVMLARREAFKLLNKAWLEQRVRLSLTGYMVKS